jgi:hypothetical protein
MIKIERSTAVNPTIVRNDKRQPVTLNMTITAEELASLTADSGSILYSVDEMEVKTIDFQPAKQPAPAPVIDAVEEPAAEVASPVAKPIIQPARKATKATQA